MPKSKASSKLILIIAMVTCYAMIFIDESGIAVTLPSIQRSLSLTNNSMHWIVNSYLLSLSALLLLGGKLSDLFGTRRIFSIGGSIFIIGSIICAAALSSGMIIFGRIIQGVGASLLMPCINVLIRANVSKKDYGKIFGLILGFSNFFYAVAPFIGGVLTEYLSWRWFFWVNLPIGIISISCTYYIAKTSKQAKSATFSDIKGTCSFIIALSTFILATMQGSLWGWSSGGVITLFVIAALGFIYFVKTELSTKHPLLDLSLFKIKRFATANIILFCACLSLSIMVFWALWLQISLKFSPAVVGAALLPASIMFIFIPRLAGAWHDKSGSRTPLVLGTCLVLCALLWITITAPKESYTWMVFGLIAFGVGIPLTIPVSVMTIMTSVKESQSGMASGTFTTVRQLALTVGIAVLSALMPTSKYVSGMHYTLSLQHAMIAITLVAAIAYGVTFTCIRD